MKWLKKLFCKLFGCKCGCQEGKPCTCKVAEEKVVVETKQTKSTTKKEAKKSASKPKKKVIKKTTKKAKK